MKRYLIATTALFCSLVWAEVDLDALKNATTEQEITSELTQIWKPVIEQLADKSYKEVIEMMEKEKMPELYTKTLEEINNYTQSIEDKELAETIEDEAFYALFELLNEKEREEFIEEEFKGFDIKEETPTKKDKSKDEADLEKESKKFTGDIDKELGNKDADKDKDSDSNKDKETDADKDKDSDSNKDKETDADKDSDNDDQK